MMLMRMVRGVTARRTASGSTRPVPSTGRQVTVAPSFSRNRQRRQYRRVFGLLRDDVVAFVAPGEERALSARLLDSLPPLGEDDLVGRRIEQRSDLFVPIARSK